MFNNMKIDKIETIIDYNPELYLKRAENALSRGDVENALRECDIAIEYSNNNVHYIIEKIRVLMSSRQYKEAIDHIELNFYKLWTEAGQEKLFEILVYHNEAYHIFFEFETQYTLHKFDENWLYYIGISGENRIGKGFMASIGHNLEHFDIRNGEFKNYNLNGSGSFDRYRFNKNLELHLEGQFKDNILIKGKLLSYLENGQLATEYIGTFNDSFEYHGFGKLIGYEAEMTFEGDFSNGVLVEGKETTLDQSFVLTHKKNAPSHMWSRDDEQQIYEEYYGMFDRGSETSGIPLNGQGWVKYTAFDGRVMQYYVGELKEAAPYGKGKLIQNHMGLDSVKKGHFIDSLMDGYCELSFTNPEGTHVVKGMFKEDSLLPGQLSIEIALSNGSFIHTEGEFTLDGNSDIQDGGGIREFKFLQGTTKETIEQNDDLIYEKYSGQFKGGLMHGTKGELIREFSLASGKPSLKYVGSFLNDIPHGIGEANLSSGDSYKGEYKDGAQHGYGIGIENGVRKEGTWKKDEFVGKRNIFQRFGKK